MKGRIAVVLCCMLVASVALAGELDGSKVSARAQWVAHLDVAGLLTSRFGRHILNEIEAGGHVAGIAWFAETVGFDPTRDLRQDALLRVLTNLDKYDPTRPFEPWLFAVAGNLAISRQRSRRPDEQAPPGPEPVADAAEPSQCLAERERTQGLWSAARELLTDRQYAAVWLRYGREMSIRQVSREMGLTRTYVKVTLFRARRRLLNSPAFARWV